MAKDSKWDPIDNPVVSLDDPKYGTTIAIPSGPKNLPFRFGVEKAVAIVRHYAHIKTFVEEHGGKSKTNTLGNISEADLLEEIKRRGLVPS